jgi:hypothetical protein
MKSIKMLGLAVVAALALTAVVGASSASAMILCKTNSYTCSESNRYPAGTVIEAKLRGSTKFEMYSKNWGLLRCNNASFTAKTTTAGAPGIFGGPAAEVTSTNLGECTGGTFHLTKGKTSFVGEGLTSNGGLGIEYDSLGSHCVYAGPQIAIIGGAPARGSESGERKFLGGTGACSSLQASAEWEFLKPSPMYLAWE